MNEKWEESLARLEQHCGLPEGFHVTLLRETDWAFVIKLHAFFERAVSQLLTKTVGMEELSEIFSQMDMSNTRTGKLAFVKALKLLPKEHIIFVRGLSELRNKLAHNVENAVGFDIAQHFADAGQLRSAKDRSKLANQWAFGVRDGEQPQEHIARFQLRIQSKKRYVPREELFYMAPKVPILASAMAVLDAISLCTAYGVHMWQFLMEAGDSDAFVRVAHEIFERAKTGDPDLVFTTKEKLERLNPALKIKIDTDGQPVVESLAAAFYAHSKRILEQL